MPPKPSTDSVLVFAGTVPIRMHVGGGVYVDVIPGDPVPDGVDPSTLGPDWVPGNNKPPVTATPTEEV